MSNNHNKKQELLHSICAYIDAHLSEKITLPLVAEHCGVSVSTITQLFQKTLHTTFHTLLTQRRLEAAKELIHSGMPLEKVGKAVGYCDHSSFYRAFRQSFGVSPREFRRADVL